MQVDSNKTELFSFLSKVLLRAFCKKDKEIVLTDGKGVLFIQLLQDVHTLVPCSMKKLIVVCYCTYHIDVVVLAVIVINHLDVNYG